MVELERSAQIQNHPDTEHPGSQYNISTLRSSEVQDFSKFMQTEISKNPYRSCEENSSQAYVRTESYYERALKSDDFTLLVAKDTNGNVVGAFEAEMSQIGGKDVGHIRWVCVEENSRGGGAATGMYEEYLRILDQRGDVFAVTAYVDDENVESLGLHKKLGFAEEFYRQEGGAWYFKRL